MANAKWPEQSIFIERVKQFCKKNGLLTPRGAVKLDETSKLFHLSPVTLQQFIYHKTRSRPHFDTLSRIARVIACSVSELTGGPSDPPPWVALAKWEKLSERERLFATGVFDDVFTDELTETEKAELFGIYHDAKDRILRLRKATLASRPKVGKKSS